MGDFYHKKVVHSSSYILYLKFKSRLILREISQHADKRIDNIRCWQVNDSEEMST